MIDWISVIKETPDYEVRVLVHAIGFKNKDVITCVAYRRKHLWRVDWDCSLLAFTVTHWAHINEPQI